MMIFEDDEGGCLYCIEGGCLDCGKCLKQDCEKNKIENCNNEDLIQLINYVKNMLNES